VPVPVVTLWHRHAYWGGSEAALIGVPDGLGAVAGACLGGGVEEGLAGVHGGDRRFSSVSHRTAAHALTTLRDEGLIISVRGKGYYVASTPAGR
jgi:hypothetical protein